MAPTFPRGWSELGPHECSRPWGAMPIPTRYRRRAPGSGGRAQSEQGQRVRRAASGRPANKRQCRHVPERPMTARSGHGYVGDRTIKEAERASSTPRAARRVRSADTSRATTARAGWRASRSSFTVSATGETSTATGIMRLELVRRAADRRRAGTPAGPGWMGRARRPGRAPRDRTRRAPPALLVRRPRHPAAAGGARRVVERVSGARSACYCPEWKSPPQAAHTPRLLLSACLWIAL